MFTGAKATYVPDPATPARTVGEGELLAVFRQADRARFVLKRAKAPQHNEGIRAEATRLKAIHNNSEELDYRLDFVVDEGETEGLSWFVTRWVDSPLYTGAKASFRSQAKVGDREGGQAYVIAVSKVGDPSNTRLALKKAKEAKFNERIKAEAAQLRKIHKICYAPKELVPEVLEEGETEGIRWFVMPWYVHNLDQKVDGLGRVDLLRWLARFARLVERFHTATGGLIVHHDIKPLNVLVWEDAPEKLLLADFGGARGLGRLHAEESTETGMRAYTAPYAPPEADLPQGEQATMAADRFSLAASIFKLLAGQGCKLTRADPFTPPGRSLTDLHQNARNGHLSDEKAQEYETGKQMALRDLLKPQGSLLIPGFDAKLIEAVTVQASPSEGAPSGLSAEVKAALDALKADLKVALSIIPDHRTVAPGQLALRLDALADALSKAPEQDSARQQSPQPVRQEVPSISLAGNNPLPPLLAEIELPAMPPPEAAPPPQREPVPSVQAPRPLPRPTKAVPFTPPAAPPPVVAPPPPRVVVLPDPPQRPEPIAPPAEAPASNPAPTKSKLRVGVVLAALLAIASVGVEQLVKMLTKTAGLHWVAVPAGVGQIGDVKEGSSDEKPAFRVAFTTSFEMLETEVTNRQYARLVWGHQPINDEPVVNVPWDKAKTWCEAAGGRLPTELEWEYATRAGGEGTYGLGQGGEGVTTLNLRSYAWLSPTDEVDSKATTHPVKQKKPNAWGLYDLWGNVWEWTLDGYEDTAWKQLQASGRRDDTSDNVVITDPGFVDTIDNAPPVLRVGRGGSAWGGPRDLRSGNRNGITPSYSDEDLGFRCVRAPARHPLNLTN